MQSINSLAALAVLFTLTLFLAACGSGSGQSADLPPQATGAAVEGKFLAANQIDVLATLPTRDEAISQLMSVIQGATSKLARTLAAIRDQKEAAAA